MIVIVITFFPQYLLFVFSVWELQTIFHLFLVKTTVSPYKGYRFMIDLLFNLVSVFKHRGPFVKQFCLANIVTLNCKFVFFLLTEQNGLFKQSKCTPPTPTALTICRNWLDGWTIHKWNSSVLSN